MPVIVPLHSSVRQVTSTRGPWFAEFEARAWDRALEEDAAAGRLDELAEEALRDHRSGDTTEL